MTPTPDLQGFPGYAPVWSFNYKRTRRTGLNLLVPEMDSFCSCTSVSLLLPKVPEHQPYGRLRSIIREPNMLHLTRYNIATTCVIALGSFSYGFGSAVFVTVIGLPGFYDAFELDPTTSRMYRCFHLGRRGLALTGHVTDITKRKTDTANILGAVNAVYFTGCALGSLGQSFLADWLGRKKALYVAAILALIGSALVAGSVKIGMLIAVRVVQGGGQGMLLALVPLYLSEVAPPHIRGFLTGLTTLSFGIGYVIVGWIAIACYHASNLTLSWRLPLALATVPPMALLAGLSFVSETPRFLVWRGQREEAWRVIKKLHYDPADPQDEGARAEFTQIVRQVEFDKEQNTSFIQMFKKPTWRRRSLLAMFATFAAQCTGVWTVVQSDRPNVYGITNYLPLIFASLGMTGDVPLILYASYNTLGTVCVLASIILVDRVGRRPLIGVDNSSSAQAKLTKHLVTGYCLVAGVLLAEALLQWKYIGTTSKGGNGACIMCIFLYIVVFQCVDAPAFAWVAEIFPTNLRAKGVSLAIFSLFVGTITFTAPSPLAFKNIGWHMFLIYFGLAIVAAIIAWFFIVETKGVPMEEIGALFGDEVVVHLTTDGHGIVEDKSGPEEVENVSNADTAKV
ncbi:general substrate transporter [Exophiala viscosa]|uniref:general substrate transporter n=1 Tax=Exophiala viscosa TaxID=2486360 RepID=UPI0021900C12|nr:general substrate transporter [Exophiala viscosa]